MTFCPLIPRKIQSAITRLQDFWCTRIVYFKSKLNRHIKIGIRCNFGADVILRATDGGTINIGVGASIGQRSKIISHGGHIIIGNNVFIGDGSVIVCRENIQIGPDSLVAEYVVIRDQDHDTSIRPIRSAGFRSSPILIGQDVWIGCKASILRGVSVGDGAVIGAHALVRSDVPAFTLAVGVPARVVGPMNAKTW